MEFKQAASHILDIVYEVKHCFFLIFFILSDFNQLNCIFIIDFIKSSSTRTFMGEQKAKASEPLSHAQFSAEHKTSLQLA